MAGAVLDGNSRFSGNLGNPAPIQVTLITLIISYSGACSETLAKLQDGSPELKTNSSLLRALACALAEYSAHAGVYRDVLCCYAHSYTFVTCTFMIYFMLCGCCSHMRAGSDAIERNGFLRTCARAL